MGVGSVGVLIKDGVRFVSPVAAMAAADLVVSAIFHEMSADCVLTGGIECHEWPSKHVYGGARDYGIKHLTDAQKDRMESETKRRLNDAYYSAIEDRGEENEHLHVQYPRKGMSL